MCWPLHTELLKSFTRHPTPSELAPPWLVAPPWSPCPWFTPPATPSGVQSSRLQQFLPCRGIVRCPGPHIRSLSPHPPLSPPRSNHTTPIRLPRASPSTSKLEAGSGRSADSIGMRGRCATGMAAACRRTDLGLLPTAVGWHRKGGWYLATSDRCLRTPASDQRPSPGAFILPHSTAAAATLLYGSHSRRKGVVRRAVAHAGPGPSAPSATSVSNSWNSAVCLAFRKPQAAIPSAVKRGCFRMWEKLRRTKQNCLPWCAGPSDSTESWLRANFGRIKISSLRSHPTPALL